MIFLRHLQIVLRVYAEEIRRPLAKAHTPPAPHTLHVVTVVFSLVISTWRHFLSLTSLSPALPFEEAQCCACQQLPISSPPQTTANTLGFPLTLFFHLSSNTASPLFHMVKNVLWFGMDPPPPPPPAADVNTHTPQCCIDLEGLAEHLGSGVFQQVPAQVHLPEAGVGTQSVDQNRAPLAKSWVGQRERLQGLEEIAWACF